MISSRHLGSGSRFKLPASAWSLLAAGLLLVGLAAAGLYLTTSQAPLYSRCPEPSCLDVLILYHEDDAAMLINNGGLDSAMDNLIGVRNFYILSARNATLSRYLERHHRPGTPRVHWIDEGRAPFTRKDFEAPKRAAGWFYQQALKYWAVAHVPELCNDVMVLDSDNLWLRKFDVRMAVPKPRDPMLRVGRTACTTYKYKYCLSSIDSGAYDSDIANGDYHHFVNWLLGMPKELRTTHTAISNWQVMQRDVLASLELSLHGRGYSSLHEAFIAYGANYHSMSEYEAYFSLMWQRYRERVEPVYLPFMLRDPKKCDYHDSTAMSELQDKTVLVYLTCHDHWGTTGGIDDFYINCKGRETQCGQPLAKPSSMWGRLGLGSRQSLVS